MTQRTDTVFTEGAARRQSAAQRAAEKKAGDKWLRVLMLKAERDRIANDVDNHGEDYEGYNY